MSLTRRAENRFRDLRNDAGLSYDKSVADGWLPPAGLCIAAVARIAAQPSSKSLLSAIRKVQDRVRASFDFLPYASGSLHVSMLGCTAREETDTFAPDRRTAVTRAISEALSGQHSCAMHFGNLNLIGVQAFIEVIPATDAWAVLRASLGTAMVALGESPILYPDAEPIHLNIGRFGGNEQAAALQALVNQQLTVSTTLDISVVEALITDFSLSESAVESLDKYLLSTKNRALNS